MDSVYRFVNSELGANLTVLVLTISAGIAVVATIFGLGALPRGRPHRGTRVFSSGQLQMLEVRLDQQQLGISANEYLVKGLTLGIPIGIGLFLLVGSILLVPVGVAVGFVITQTRLEQLRDRKQIDYTKRLASACDIVRTAYNVNPSLKKALDAVAEYGVSPVKEDFEEILVAASQERFVEGLQAIAERRRSIVFDTVATSLIRANESSGEVNDMLIRLADSTRQNVAAFEHAVTSQINARSNVQWGVFGPWLIFSVFRVITLSLAVMMGNTSLFAPMNGFFATLAGNVLVFAAALFSIWLYRNAMGVAQRGLVVRRIVTTDTHVQTGQQPQSGQTGQSLISAQAHPAKLG
jgi:hypothetical protein